METITFFYFRAGKPSVKCARRKKSARARPARTAATRFSQARNAATLFRAIAYSSQRHHPASGGPPRGQFMKNGCQVPAAGHHWSSKRGFGRMRLASARLQGDGLAKANDHPRSRIWLRDPSPINLDPPNFDPPNREALKLDSLEPDSPDFDHTAGGWSPDCASWASIQRMAWAASLVGRLGQSCR